MRFRLRVNSVFLLWFLLAASVPATAASGPAWQGVDESVVEKIAAEHGRPARAPVIDTDKGDLLLFMFLLAGVAGGFVAGYYWRMLTEKKGGSKE